MGDRTPPRGSQKVRRIDGGPDDDRTERVGADEVGRGDRLLVRPGERVGVDGTVVEIRHERAPTESDEDAGNRSDDREDAAGLTVETADGERRNLNVGDAVGADETVRGAVAVVEVSGAALFPWLGAALGGTVGLRAVLVVLAVVVAFAGSGLGIYGTVTEYATQSGERVVDAMGIGNRDAADRAPPAPAVEVEAPNTTDDRTTDDPPDGGDSDGSDGSDGDPDTTTDEPDTTTAPETATTTETETTGGSETTARSTRADRTERSGGESGGAGAPGDDEPLSPRLTLDGVDPDPVRTPDGTVDELRATVDGTVSWNGQANVVLVVQTWVPGGEWEEVHRTTVAGASPVSLADALGTVTYASGERTAAFENLNAGETERTTGRVAVTAVFFDRSNGEVGRTTREATFEAQVTNSAVDLVLGDGGEVSVIDFTDTGNGDGSAESGSGTVAPGSAGSNTVPLRNDGDRRGVLRLETVSYVSYENGLTGPEAAVDTTGGDPGAGAGELDDAVEIRARAEFANGTSRYAVGDENSYRSVASLETASFPVGELGPGESLDLVVDFRVPESTGNEIQSDTIVVDFEFTLTESP